MDAVKGIVQALHAAFPDNEIYTESIEHGFCPPCFSVRELSASDAPYPGGRWQRRQSFDVRFFPKGRRPQEQCRTVGAQLFTILSYLPGFAACGTSMNREITDGVLHFFVNYNYFVREDVKQDNMEQIQTETEVRP